MNGRMNGLAEWPPDRIGEKSGGRANDWVTNE